MSYAGRRFSICAIVGVLYFGAAHQTLARSGWTRQAAPQAGLARVITDEAGRSVTIPADVRRIVTLAPNLTETIYALGLGDRLVGDTDYCDTPSAAKAKPHVGAPVNPSLEAIVGLHPDLVLATTSINRRETVEALTHLGIAVYASDPRTIRGMLASFARMAELLGAGAQGVELVRRLQTRLEALHSRLADQPLVPVLFVVWEDPLISIGQNTFIADALRWAGAESVIVSKQNWPQVSLEEVVRLQPDYIVLTSNHVDTEMSQVSDLRERPAWMDLQAVEAGHVAVLSEEVARPSPGLIDAIEQLARELHPRIFAPTSAERRPKLEARLLTAPIAGLRKESNQCVR